MSERRPEASVDEREVMQVLAHIASISRVHRMQLEDARYVIERLSEDYWPAAVLVQSLAVATARPAHLGTPRHLEETAIALMRDLEG